MIRPALDKKADCTVLLKAKSRNQGQQSAGQDRWHSEDLSGGDSRKDSQLREGEEGALRPPSPISVCQSPR